MAVVPCTSEGLTLADNTKFVALDGTRTFAVQMRDVLIPDDLVLADPSDGFIRRIRAGFVLLQAGMAFGQIRGSLNSSLSAGAGMRVGWLQSQSSSHTAGFANTGSAPFAAISGRETLPPTPRFDLSYQPDNRNLFYAAIAKGFRAGGPGTPARCDGSVDPDEQAAPVEHSTPCKSRALRRMPAFFMASVRSGPGGSVRARSSAATASASKSSLGRGSLLS